MTRHCSWTAGIIAALACTAAMESSAEACSPPLAGLTGTFPESGGTLPGNAAIFFEGYSISLDSVSVTVDGEPASLEIVTDVPAAGYSIVARIEPAPSEGQAIAIEGDFCNPVESCGVKRIELTAGAADTEAPPGPSGLSFDLHDHADFKSSGGDCLLDTDLSWWLTAEGEVAEGGEAPVIITIEAFRDETFTAPVLSLSRFMNAASLSVAVGQTAEVLDGADAPEAFCFRATALDTAGNIAGETAHACRPCYYRADPETAQPSATTPPEPAWTEADIYPGGTCDSGMGPGGAGGSGAGGSDSAGGAGAGSGDGETSESGCSFRAAGGAGGTGAPGVAALALVACAALAGRRRR
ncbi:hypothetical protein [Sorangium sp. So ce1099]|uniref:hypothetical protein n=1 Tax=Sorangium sp. So ce1099 TaxID=3133331 RepID=UPI003F620442